MTNFLKSNDTGILIIRIAVGILLPFHGYSKLISGIDWMAPMLNEFGIPPFVGYGVYIGEIIAPICLLIGFRTRICGAYCSNRFVYGNFSCTKRKSLYIKCRWRLDD